MNWRMATWMATWMAAVVGLGGAGMGQQIRAPFEDELRQAVAEYRAGRFDGAREHTRKALAILDEAKAGTVGDALPPAAEGWEAGEIAKEDVPQFLGGGRTVKRLYQEKAGRKRLQLEVIFDAPMGKLLMGLLANDQMAEAQGFKVRRVGRERALLKQSGDTIELNMPIEDKLLVKLTGSGGAEEKDVLALAREVDRAALKGLE